MSTILRLIPFLLLGVASTSCSEFYNPSEAKDSLLTTDYVINDSIYSKDSAYIIQQGAKGFEYFANQMYDSVVSVSQRIYPLAKKLVEYRYDSTLYFFWSYGIAGYGNNIAQLGKYDIGLERLLESTDLIKKQFGENYPWLADNYNGMANIYANRGDYETAISYLNKSLHFKYQSSVPLDCYRCHPYFNLGNIYEAQGKLEEAIEYYINAASDFFLAGKNGAPFCYENAGRMALKTKNFDKAFSLTLRSIDLKKQLDPTNKAWPLSGLIQLISIAREQGDIKTAENWVIRAEKLVSSFPNDQFVGDYYSERAKIAALASNPKDMLEYASLAIKSWENHYGKGHPKIIDINSFLGSWYLKGGKFDSAISFFQKAIQLQVPQLLDGNMNSLPQLDVMPPQLPLLTLLNLKGQALIGSYKKTGSISQLQTALELYSLSIDFFDKLRFSYGGQAAKSALAAQVGNVFENALETVYLLFEKTQDEKYLAVSFDFLENRHSSILREYIQDNQAKLFANIPDSLIAKEKILKLDLAFYNKLIFEEENTTKKPNTEILSYWKEKIFHLQLSQDSLQRSLEEKYPSYYRLKYQSSIVSLNEIVNRLGKGEAILSFFIGDHALFLQTITRNSTTISRQPINTSFLLQIDTVRQLFNSPSSTFDENLNKVLMELSKRLLPNSSTFANIDRLIIIPDGQLGYIPFQAFPSLGDAEKSKTRYLFEDFTIRYEYASSFLFSEEKKRTNGTRYIGFAPSYTKEKLSEIINPNEDLSKSMRSSLNPLRFNIEEVEEVSSVMDGLAYTGPAASKEKFLETASQASILHLAMHSLIDDDQPDYSQLVFSTIDSSNSSSALHAYELYNTRLDAELAVLSACNTGTGRLAKGEGIMSFARAFKYAGCPNIIMSLWPANDATTKQLTTTFFAYLKEGMSKDKAMQKAQIDFLNNPKNVEFQHPFYWAGFVLIGDDLPLSHFESSRSSWIWLVLFIPLLLLLWMRQRRNM